MNTEKSLELYRQHREGQDRFIYFLLTITIASIGFTITQTKDLEQLRWIHTPLGLSLICWGISILNGFRNREYTNSALIKDSKLIKIELTGKPINENVERLNKSLDIDIEEATKSKRWQRRNFILGTLLYLVFHLLDIIF